MVKQLKGDICAMCPQCERHVHVPAYALMGTFCKKCDRGLERCQVHMQFIMDAPELKAPIRLNSRRKR